MAFCHGLYDRCGAQIDTSAILPSKVWETGKTWWHACTTHLHVARCWLSAINCKIVHYQASIRLDSCASAVHCGGRRRTAPVAPLQNGGHRRHTGGWPPAVSHQGSVPSNAHRRVQPTQCRRVARVQQLQQRNGGGEVAGQQHHHRQGALCCKSDPRPRR